MSDHPATVLRQRLDRRRPALGTWCSLPSSSAVEVVAGVGYDWICLDLQHGWAGPGDLHALLQAADAARTPTLVRVPSNEPAAIMRALDQGAAGVVVPLVHNAHDARAAVAACRYPPVGSRSWGPLRHPQSPAAANHNVLCIVMVESTEAVNAITDIASVPGVDGVLLGPSDLSLSAFGELHGDLDGIKAEVAQACHNAGVWAGIACGTPAQAAAASALGFQLILIGWDLALLETAEADLLGQSRLAVGFPVEGG